MSNASTQDESRNIPEDIKRIVRQRCGFGCVKCGTPLYQYDHIEEWSVVKKHDAHNITLLCPEHHVKKTNGLLTEAQVKAADASPFNRDSPLSPWSKVDFEGAECTIEFGTNVFRGAGQDLVGILMDDFEAVAFERVGSEYMLNLALLDDNNEFIMAIVRNELFFGTDIWDVTRVGNRLTFRRGSRDILLDLEIRPPGHLIIHSGIFNHQGAKIVVGTRAAAVPQAGQLVHNKTAIGANVGLAVGFDPHMREASVFLPSFPAKTISDASARRWLIRNVKLLGL